MSFRHNIIYYECKIDEAKEALAMRRIENRSVLAVRVKKDEKRSQQLAW